MRRRPPSTSVTRTRRNPGDEGPSDAQLRSRVRPDERAVAAADARPPSGPAPAARFSLSARVRGLAMPSLTARVVENGILAAAMKVFARRGYAATRVEDV